MKSYLFRFGFCTPGQWRDNDLHGWDDESSSALFIDSETEEDALNWGREVAEEFCRSLFLDAHWEGVIPSWKAAGFAHWIEGSPSQFSFEQLSELEHVKSGDMPNFKRL